MSRRTWSPIPLTPRPEPSGTPCQPVGLVPAVYGERSPRGVCGCGDPVTMEWSGHDWVARSDVDGSVLRWAPKPPVLPHILEQMANNPKIGPEATAEWESWHWGTGVPWCSGFGDTPPGHSHYSTTPDNPEREPVPECHGWPMQAVPYGWRCRITSRIHAAPE